MYGLRASTFVFVVCCAQALLDGPAVRAQTINDTGAWLALFADGDIESSRSESLKWWFDGQLRFLDEADGFGQSLVRPGIGWRLGGSAAIWAGYAWIHTSPGNSRDFDEHRLWQQVTWSDEGCGASLGYRSRLEQRFLETGSDTGWRFRQLLAVRRPLGSTQHLTAVAWDEVFIHLNDTDWGADGGFDRNRAFLGLGFKHHPDSPFRVEVGYLNQYTDVSGRPDISDHLLSINLFWNP